MLVVFRNPKDTLVSYYHFYNNNPVLPKTESWDSFYTDFMKGEGDSPLFFDCSNNRFIQRRIAVV